MKLECSFLMFANAWYKTLRVVEPVNCRLKLRLFTLVIQPYVILHNVVM